MKIFIISYEEMDDIMKIVKSPEESGLLMKGVSEGVKNEAKNKNLNFAANYEAHLLLVYLGIYKQVSE